MMIASCSMSISTKIMMDVQQQLHVISHILGPLDACGARGSVVTNETAFDPPKWAVLRG